MRTPRIADKGERSADQDRNKYIVHTEVRIHVSPDRVWEALVNPAIIWHYMFGAQVISDWNEGSSISWKGTWDGKPYNDRGTILRFKPEEVLQYSHFSPLSGLPDTPENARIVTIELSREEEYTQVSLSQDNNPTKEAGDHSKDLWDMMLNGLKNQLENDAIRNLFVAYEKAFSALDMEKIAGLFADTFISAGPRGMIAQNRSDFLRLAHTAAEFYKSVGQTSARILSLHETPISNEYSLMKVHWGVTFRKTGDKLVEFDVSYLVEKTGLEPKIILFIAHQDEEQAMKGLGLMNETGVPVQ